MHQAEEQFQFKITDTQADQDPLVRAARDQAIRDLEPQELQDLREIHLSSNRIAT